MTAPDDLARTEIEKWCADRRSLRIHGLTGREPVSDQDRAEATDLAAHLASVVSRRDADLRTRIETLRDEWAADATEDEQWLNGARVSVGEAQELPAVIAKTRSHIDDLARALDGDTREDAPAPFAPAPELVGRPRVFRAETEGVDRMMGSPSAVHEPECIGLNRDDDLAGQCDCRTIRMLVIGVLQERLASVVSRRDADLRTRLTTLQAVEKFAESLAQEAERYDEDGEEGGTVADWVRDRFGDWRDNHAAQPDYTCPSACAEANHRGIEHDEWLMRLAAAGNVLSNDLIDQGDRPLDPNGAIWDHAAELNSLLPGNDVIHFAADHVALDGDTREDAVNDQFAADLNDALHAASRVPADTDTGRGQ